MRIFEVGPRDGLQNEHRILSVDQKVELIERLVAAGATDVEIGSFVHPDWIPQMADTGAVAARVVPAAEAGGVPAVRYWALVPNMRGLERAIDVGVRHVAVFASASETHSHKNLNRSIDEAMATFEEVVREALVAQRTVRAYVSMAFGSPYEPEIDFEGTVVDLVERFLSWGADHVSLGDTVGLGRPPEVRKATRLAIDAFGPDRVALHLHDTRGMGVANALVALEEGVELFDASIGGIGGCPYAAGATGNLATEDLLYLLDAMEKPVGGWSMERVIDTGQWLEDQVGLSIPSRNYRYLMSQRATPAA